MDDDTLARLITMPNVLVTSHQAFLTEEALNNIAETTVNNIVGFFKNGYCANELRKAETVKKWEKNNLPLHTTPDVVDCDMRELFVWKS